MRVGRVVVDVPLPVVINVGLDDMLVIVVVLEDTREELVLSALELGVDVVVLLLGSVTLCPPVPLIGATPAQKPFHTAREQFSDCTPVTDASNAQLPAS